MSSFRVRIGSWSRVSKHHQSLIARTCLWMVSTRLAPQRLDCILLARTLPFQALERRLTHFRSDTPKKPRMSRRQGHPHGRNIVGLSEPYFWRSMTSLIAFFALLRRFCKAEYNVSCTQSNKFFPLRLHVHTYLPHMCLQVPVTQLFQISCLLPGQ